MEACDVDPGSTAATPASRSRWASNLCQMCDEANGPFCAGGLTCLSDGTCGAFCCADGDCGSGKCDKTMPPGRDGDLGVCVHK